MKNYFGTDGIRGKAESFTPSFIGAVVAAIAEYYNKPDIVIGRDPRLSGSEITALFKGAAGAAGMSVTDAGMVPTPALAFLTEKRGAGLGVMVSASHNPPEYNGLKLFSGRGAKITTAEEEALSALIEKELEAPGISGEFVKTEANEYSLIEEYIAGVGEQFSADFRGMKVVLDGGSGAAGGAAAKLFSAFGAEVELLNDANGAEINVGTGAAHPEYLLKAAGEADIAFAYDGDGDRVMCVRHARILSGDEMLYIVLKNMIRSGGLEPPVAVGTIMTNYGAEESLKGLGISLLRTPVGDKFVSEAMEKSGAKAGGERSGHLIFKDYLNTGDGILTSLLVAKAFSEYGDEAREGYFEFPAAEGVLPATEEGKKLMRVSPEIDAFIAAESASRGVEIVARPSGTEPVIRVKAEARDTETAVLTLNRTMAYIESFIKSKIKNKASEIDLTDTQNQGTKQETLERIRFTGGVVIAPELCFISSEVVVKKGAVIHPFTVLSGATVLEEGAEVKSFSCIRDSVVGEGSVVSHTVAVGAKIGKHSSVGPFAFLRPGAVIGDGVRVGDFVEIKNAVLGDGVKAAHLTYIGDAVVGDGTNVGCGTVFANYDGAKKHRTEVGKGAFIGCNANLIAPLKIGDGAFIAGGSTVTEDVGAGEICFGRSRQVNKPGKSRGEPRDTEK